MDEEFLDYQALLDGMEIDPTPITLPCLRLLGRTPDASGQNKRAMTSNNNGDEETRDTVASGSGTHPAETIGGVEQLPAQPAALGAVTGEPVEISKTPSRSEAIQTFLAAPLLSEPTTLKIYHGTALLALSIGGPAQ
jgi:hypothetical protein